MGNILSINSSDETNNNNNTSSLIEYVDMIATNYVLTQSMIDMLRFTDKEYYDNMIILTSFILKNQLSDVDIGVLKDRVLNGNEPINMNNNNNEPVHLSNVNRLREITFKNKSKKEKALLLISKFYIKIMTLFSAVTAIIDPQYVYEDETGAKQYFFLKDFDSFKKLDSETKQLKINQLDNPIAFIQKRLTILKNKMTPANSNSDDFMVINPGEKFCNKDSNLSSLHDEIGIKELDALYYDVYDYESNKWNKKSIEMQEKYDEDVLLFYQIFTGKKEKPEHIQTFADIESLDLHNLQRCMNQDFFEDLVVSKQDELFQKYMSKIEQIQNITKTYKRKLLFILKQIFIRSDDNTETAFMISPQLNMKRLLQYQDEVKKNINQIYMNCERLFIEALILYETMYENQHGLLREKKMNYVNQNINTNQPSNVLDETSFILSPKPGVEMPGSTLETPSQVSETTNPLMAPIETPVFTPQASTPEVVSTPTISEQPVPITPKQPVPITSEQPVPITSEQPVPITPEQPVPITPEEPVLTTPEQPVPTTPEQPVPTVSEEPVPTVSEESVSNAPDESKVEQPKPSLLDRLLGQTPAPEAPEVPSASEAPPAPEAPEAPEAPLAPVIDSPPTTPETPVFSPETPYTPPEAIISTPNTSTPIMNNPINSLKIAQVDNNPSPVSVMNVPKIDSKIQTNTLKNTQQVPPPMTQQGVSIGGDARAFLEKVRGGVATLFGGDS